MSDDITPLERLLVDLRSGEPPSFEWVVAHVVDNRFEALWNASKDGETMLAIYQQTGDLRGVARAAARCAALALPAIPPKLRPDATRAVQAVRRWSEGHGKHAAIAKLASNWEARESEFRDPRSVEHAWEAIYRLLDLRRLIHHGGTVVWAVAISYAHTAGVTRSEPWEHAREQRYAECADVIRETLACPTITSLLPR